jgi:hypothetical protein
MTEQIIHILQLPDRCLVRKKITKAFFKRNFEMTSGERALLDDYASVTAIDWLASISPHSANVPAYIDAECTYEEVQVIALQTSVAHYDRDKLKLTDFIHKFIPYHILLAVYCEDRLIWSSSSKRINSNDVNKRVAERKFVTEDTKLQYADDTTKAFLDSLAYTGLDKTNLKILYESYTQRIVALKTAGITGAYAPRPTERTKQDVEHLEQIDGMEREITQLQNQAKKETQMNRRVELNTEIQQRRRQIEQIKTLITA